MTQSDERAVAEMQSELKDRLLDAALLEVAFDGWSEQVFQDSCRETGVEPSVARVLFPRGGVDLALAYHERGDRLMLERFALEDLPTLRLRDRIARAVRARIEVIDDKEAVRRGTALLSLPQNAAAGAHAIWGTADKIWTALGDTSDDINWYSKRASLSGVYGGTVLFWLGDESDDQQATWDFLGRRVDGILNLEKVRARVIANPVLKRVFAGPNWVLEQVRAPRATEEMPGAWGDVDGAEPTEVPPGGPFRQR